MQHKKGFFKSIARFAEDKGFYIILGLCVVAIGVSGYVLFFTGNEPQEPLNLPDPLESGTLVPDDSQESEVLDPVLVPEKEPTLEDEPVDQPVPIEEQPIFQEPEPEISVSRPIEAETPEYSRPMSGNLQREYSLDQLVYDPTMCDWRTHGGVDYECKAGDSVCAIADGSVTAVFSDPMKGNCVTLTHDGKLTSTYCGLETNTTMRTGMTVKAGEPVGTAGGSILMESAQTCHVHLEVMKDQKPVDPESLFD